MADHYGTAAAIIRRTGIKPTDLGFESDDSGDTLETFLGELLEEITDLMNRKMRRNWFTYVAPDTVSPAVPAGLHGIANDIGADSVREMVATRQTPIVRIDDFAVRVITSRILSPDAVERLKLYSPGGGVSEMTIGSDSLTGPRWLTAADLDTMDDP